MAWLGIDHKNWSRYGISPPWVIFGPLVLEALKSWAPPRLFEQDGRALIPLTVLPNVTREIVLEDLLSQLKQLYEALQSAAGPDNPDKIRPDGTASSETGPRA